jgi:hypothetical protein
MFTDVCKFVVFTANYSTKYATFITFEVFILIWSNCIHPVWFTVGLMNATSKLYRRYVNGITPM